MLDPFDGPEGRNSLCFGLGQCDPDNPCPLHSHWESIQHSYTTMLSTITVGDLLSPQDLVVFVWATKAVLCR